MLKKKYFVGFRKSDDDTPNLCISEKRRPEEEDELIQVPIEASRQPNGLMTMQPAISCEGNTDYHCSVTVG